jgi:hypothetical protein
VPPPAEGERLPWAADHLPSPSAKPCTQRPLRRPSAREYPSGEVERGVGRDRRTRPNRTPVHFRTQPGTVPIAVPLGLCCDAVLAQYCIAALGSQRSSSERVDSGEIRAATTPEGGGFEMKRATPTAYSIFRTLDDATPNKAPLRAPRRVTLPPPAPYLPCACGSCPKCRDNAKWDRIFAKFELKEADVRGVYGCPLRGL